jgi:hypothetical protein
MTVAVIDVFLRPVKLAFIIDPYDKRALTQAIQINSALWRGVYNPIIPFYKRIQ